ncbi:dihydroxyacetone synthase [Paraphaeosphaeria sporulosa]
MPPNRDEVPSQSELSVVGHLNHFIDLIAEEYRCQWTECLLTDYPHIESDAYDDRGLKVAFARVLTDLLSVEKLRALAYSVVDVALDLYFSRFVHQRTEPHLFQAAILNMISRNEAQSTTAFLPSGKHADDQAVREIRKVVIDICRQNGGGHGGSAIGMAPLAVALWKHTMRYNPHNSEWFDRDRFVLSNGHAAILLYTMLHVSGYPHVIADELKLYGSAKAVNPETGKWKATICHGHPEAEVPGVQVTTGPLGQGVANAVGLAIASKNLAASFNKPDVDLLSSRIYCVTGDGCLQEGVANEAIAIAGHLGLDNLTLLYDNNQVTCDGPVDWIVSEDTNAKVRSMGWNVIDVMDGDSSVGSIVQALADAKAYKGKPTFINIRTTIGHGTSTAGTFKSHHGTYTDEDADKYWQQGADQGQRNEDEWKQKLDRYTATYPELAAQLHQRIDGKMINVEAILGSLEVPKYVTATRQFNGVVFNILMESIPSLFAGGADLWNSNQMGDQSKRIFDSTHPEGRVIRYVTATFFMFYMYAAAGVRMGALSDLKVVHIATHHSIGEGQNGPTHQPVELDSLFRAMPKLQYIRPADSEEVVGAWMTALTVEHAPSIISLARDPGLSLISCIDRHKVGRGGYVLEEKDDAEVTLVSCGSELEFAVAAKELNAGGIRTRVISMPCIRLFEEQPEAYQDTVLSNSKHIVSVEAYIPTGRENMRRFGIDTDGVVRKVKTLVGQEGAKAAGPRRRWQLLQ